MISTRMKRLGIVVLVGVGVFYGSVTLFNSCKRESAISTETAAAVAQSQGQAAAAAAQAVPDHTAAIKAAEAKAEAAEAKVKVAESRASRARQERDVALAKLAAQPPAPPDARDEVIAKDKVVIEEQAGHIEELQNQVAEQKVQVDTLTLALSDEKLKSKNWEAAYNAATRQAAAQQAATNAWKKANASAEIKGGIKGTVLGAFITLLIKH